MRLSVQSCSYSNPIGSSVGENLIVLCACYAQNFPLAFPFLSFPFLSSPHFHTLLALSDWYCLTVSFLYYQAPSWHRERLVNLPATCSFYGPLIVDPFHIAIHSVFNKQGLPALAKGLIKHDIRLLASGGTAKRKPFFWKITSFISTLTSFVKQDCYMYSLSKKFEAITTTHAFWWNGSTNSGAYSHSRCGLRSRVRRFCLHCYSPHHRLKAITE